MRDDEAQIGSGKSPEGADVSFWRVERPSTIGAPGATGLLVEARGADGKRITHSDTLEGLKKAGYVVTGEQGPVPPVVPTPLPPADKVPEPVKPAPEKSIEDELA